MNKIILVLLLCASTPCYSSDYFQEQLEQDYRDSYIERHNAKMERINDNSKYEEQMQDLRESNMQNLYINSKDYKGETIVIEKKELSFD